MGACLTGAPVDLTTQLFGVLGTVFMIMNANTKHGKTSLEKKNNGQGQIGTVNIKKVKTT